MSKIAVDLIDHMGTDMSVVNAARVSMGKCRDINAPLEEADIKLIKYLQKHKHDSPFFHATAQFRVSVPIFVERQIFKHQIGLSYNSISFRYVSPSNDWYNFETMRQGSASIKQGSLPDPVERHEYAKTMYDHACRSAFGFYESLLAAGVCKEQARAVLPMSTMTEFVVTGSLSAFARMYNLRSKPDAQAEIREYAQLIHEQMSKLFPISWAVLTNQEKSND